MLSLRTLVLLGATIYLLPTDPAQQDRFVASANQALGWATTFCQRQPETCAKADVVWQDLKDKAHFGVGVVYGLATRKMGNGQTADTQQARGWTTRPSAYDSSRRSLDGSPRGTLTNADFAPVWRGQTGE